MLGCYGRKLEQLRKFIILLILYQVILLVFELFISKLKYIVQLSLKTKHT
jgi:hypothetical protein